MTRKVLVIIIPIVAIASIILVFQNKWKTEAFVTQVRVGNVTDSVSGNVRVLAESSYELRSRTQGTVTRVALLPFGKLIEVDANETLVRLDTDDLKRQLRQTLLTKKNYDERKNAPQPTAIQLELEEKQVVLALVLSLVLSLVLALALVVEKAIVILKDSELENHLECIK